MFFKRYLWFFLLILIYQETNAQVDDYPWANWVDLKRCERIKDIEVPRGFHRELYEADTYQSWLQNFPLKPYGERIHLYNGAIRPDQGRHFRILDLDVGNKNLQQCADTAIRLYAEYLYAKKMYDKIAFNFTNGSRVNFQNWVDGYRPEIRADSVVWLRKALFDQSYYNFRDYLQNIFKYAGSHSLSKELKQIIRIRDIQVGDIFIEGGFPGHTVVVVDLAKDETNDRIIFLLAQGVMPAQDIHIMKNLKDEKLSPWYELNATDKLYIPAWTFEWTDLKRFQ